MTSTMLEQLSLVFLAPFEVTVERTLLAEPGPGEVQITSSISAISPGTEMLFYRGQVPEAMAVDETITALDGTFSYPLRYGYALVGTVTAVGPGADPSWLGRLVFTFAPHQSHFVTAVENLVPVPEGLAAEDAVLLPFMETAVSFLMDGRPLIGENVVVFGQGVIGLLTVALLASYPLGKLAAIDPIPLRRDWSGRLGAEVALDPAAPDYDQALTNALTTGGMYSGADLVFELSGRPETLEAAVNTAGFDGRIVVGSWYGQKRAPIDLGGRFHRRQIKIISSQVSHIAPRWSGRFDKQRRLDVAWRLLAQHRPGRLITHRFPLQAASEAYRVIDEEPSTAVQVVFDYRGLSLQS